VSTLVGKTAIVTGASRGIGAAIVRRLSDDGCQVVLADIEMDATEETADSLSSPAVAVECDVASSASVNAMIEVARREFGTINFLVNNAAILRNNYLVNICDEEWERVLAVNLGGPFRCIRAVSPLMVEQRAGRIVTVASGSSAGMIGQAHYASSKAGVYGLTKTAALELARYSITVNAVSPGFVVTDMTQQLADRVRQDVGPYIEEAAAAIPLRRAGQPEDIAGAVRFLLGDDASFMTGQVLNVRGGPGPAAS
jgi:3-oxoacyl-[acyl-carrier protein] reductase